MLSTQDFAQRVWVSLEDIRERLAVLETEMWHTQCHLRRLEAGLQSHVTDHQHPNHGEGAKDEAGNGASVTIHLSRKALRSSGLVGGGILAAVIAMGKGLGWW